MSPEPSKKKDMTASDVDKSNSSTTMKRPTTIESDSGENMKNVAPNHILTSDPKALLDAVDLFIGKSQSNMKNDSGTDKPGNETTSINVSSGDFSAISFLNHHFSTESLLITHLPALHSTIQDQIASLSTAISSSIHTQSQNHVQTTNDVQQAKTAIANLHSRITLVQRKARMSERAVLEITRDMKRLDYAKRHLQKTITALKRLHMLIHAVEQLKLASEQMRYREAANLVDAVRELLKHFQGYQSSIEKMRQMRDNVKTIRKNLQDQIFDGFKVAGGIPIKIRIKNKNEPKLQDPDSQKNPTSSPNKPMLLPHSVLAEACHVIDALGMDVRLTFIETFCNDHLRPFPKLFSPESKASLPSNPKSFKKYSEDDLDTESPPSSLDQVDRRFAWFRRLMRSIDEKFQDVFPIYWQVHYHLTVSFLKQNLSHFLALLDGPYKDKDANNVTVLLQALQKTILFEKEMTAWLLRDYSTIFANSSIQDAQEHKEQQPTAETGEALEFDEDGNAVIASSAQGIRIKYNRQMKEKNKNKKPTVVENNPRIPLVNTDNPEDEIPYSTYYESKTNKPMPPLLTQASSAFDKYMSPYIDLEKENMNERLAAADSDSAVDTRGELPVFTSSTNLFVYIKNSIARCTALTKGATFFDLYEAFEDTLKKYATVLSQKFPPTIPSSNIGGISIASLSSNTSTSSASFKVSPGEEVTICHVIDTCEYCADTVEALEELIRGKMEDNFKDKIDLSSTQEAFYDVTAKGLRVLVSGLENQVEPIFKEMYSINWGVIDAVGEESPYVETVNGTIQPFVLTVKKLIPASYFRNFCNKFAAAFTNLYYNSVIRLKRISESGTQQLLLDVYNLKTFLLKLPVISSKVEVSSPGALSSTTNAIPPAMYTNMVTKEFNRIEILLKLIATPPELLPDMFKSTWPSGTALDFQTVMNLKGMKRAEQQASLEKVGLDKNTAGGVGAVVGVSAANVSNAATELFKGKGTFVAGKVNTDLSQMRQKVDDFRKQFR